jgi:hypothetical protein
MTTAADIYDQVLNRTGSSSQAEAAARQFNSFAAQSQPSTPTQPTVPTQSVVIKNPADPFPTIVMTNTATPTIPNTVVSTPAIHVTLNDPKTDNPNVATVPVVVHPVVYSPAIAYLQDGTPIYNLTLIPSGFVIVDHNAVGVPIYGLSPQPVTPTQSAQSAQPIQMITGGNDSGPPPPAASTTDTLPALPEGDSTGQDTGSGLMLLAGLGILALLASK